MHDRLDLRSLELWTNRLVTAGSRQERERILCEAAEQIAGVHAIQVWRDLKIGGELRLTATTVHGTHEALPNAAQVRALILGELPSSAVSRVRLVGKTVAAEAPLMTLACDEIAEDSLDGLEALLTLNLVLEQESKESAVDSIRSLIDGLADELDHPQ